MKCFNKMIRKRITSVLLSFSTVFAALFGNVSIVLASGEDTRTWHMYIQNYTYAVNTDGDLYAKPNGYTEAYSANATGYDIGGIMYYMINGSDWVEYYDTDAYKNLVNNMQNLYGITLHEGEAFLGYINYAAYQANKTVSFFDRTCQPVESEDFGLLAYFSPITIKYYDNDKTTLLNTEKVGLNVETKYTAANKKDENLKFEKWVDSSGSDIDLSVDALTERLYGKGTSISVYASYSECTNWNEVKLYNKSGELYDTMYLAEGESLTVQGPDVEGYNFNCWTDENGNEVDVLAITNDVSLYAKYTNDIKSADITWTFHAYKFDPSNQEYVLQTIESNGGYDTVTNVPNHNYYESEADFGNVSWEYGFNAIGLRPDTKGDFLGWIDKTLYESTGEIYYYDFEDKLPSELKSTSNQYAFMPLYNSTYKVTYYDSDKTTLLNTENVEYGEAATYKAPNKSEEGLRFEKWVDEDDNNIDLSSVTQSMSVYAVYKTAEFVTVTYCEEDGTLIYKESVEKGCAAEADVSAKEINQKTFDTWVDEAGNSVNLNEVNEDITVYAHYNYYYTVNVYGVDYIYTGKGTQIETVDINEGEQYIITSILADVITNTETNTYNKENVTGEFTDTITYTRQFDYWYVNVNGEEVVLENNTVSNVSDLDTNYIISVYPKYKIINTETVTTGGEVNVTYKASSTSIEHYPYSEVCTPKTITDKISLVENDNYNTINVSKFMYWADEDGNEYDWSQPLLQDITVYAVYGEPYVTAMTGVSSEITSAGAVYYGTYNESKGTISSIVPKPGESFTVDNTYLSINKKYVYAYEDGNTYTVNRSEYVKADTLTVNGEIGDIYSIPFFTGSSSKSYKIKAEVTINGDVYQAEKTICISGFKTRTLNTSNTDNRKLVIIDEPYKTEYVEGEDINWDGITVGLYAYYKSGYTYSERFTKTTYNNAGFDTVPLKILSNSTLSSYTITQLSDKYHYRITWDYDDTVYVDYEFKTVTATELTGFRIHTNNAELKQYYTGVKFDDNNTIYEIEISQCDYEGNVLSTETISGSMNALSEYGTFTYDNITSLTEGPHTIPVEFTYELTGTTLSVNFDIEVDDRPISDSLPEEGYIYYWHYTLDEDGNLVYTYDGTGICGEASAGVHQFATEVKHIYMDLDTYVDNGYMYKPTLSFYLSGISTVESIEVHADNNIDCFLSSAFYNDSMLKSVIFSGGGTVSAITRSDQLVMSSNDIGMQSMFENCISLENLEWTNIDISKVAAHVSKYTDYNFANMFANAGTDKLVLDFTGKDFSEYITNHSSEDTKCAFDFGLRNTTADRIVFNGYTQSEWADAYIVLNSCNINNLEIINCEFAYYPHISHCNVDTYTLKNVTVTQKHDNTSGTELSTILSLGEDTIKPNYEVRSKINEFFEKRVLTEINSQDINIISDNSNVKNFNIEIDHQYEPIVLYKTKIENLNFSNANDSLAGVGGLIATGCDINTANLENLNASTELISLPDSNIGTLNLGDIKKNTSVYFNDFLYGSTVNEVNFIGLDREDTAVYANNAFRASKINDIDLSYLFNSTSPTLSYFMYAFSEAEINDNIIDLSQSNATFGQNVKYMFYECPADKIYLTGINTMAVSNWEGFFLKCQASYIDFSVSYFSGTTTKMFDETKRDNDNNTYRLTTFITPQIMNTYIDLPQYSFGQTFGYGWVTADDADTIYNSHITTPNLALHYMWGIKYAVNHRYEGTINANTIVKYKWANIGEAITVEDLTANGNTWSTFNHGIKSGDTLIIRSSKSINVEHGQTYYLNDINGESLNNIVGRNDIDVANNGFVLVTQDGSYTVNYYDSDHSTLLATEVYADGVLAKNKQFAKEPIIDAVNNTISTYRCNYWVDYDGSIIDWDMLDYDTDLYYVDVRNTYKLNDKQYTITGNLCINNQDTFDVNYPEGIKVTVSDSKANEVYSDEYTSAGAYTVPNLTYDTEYCIAFEDISTGDILLKVKISSDLKNLSIKTITNAENFSYNYTGVEDKVFSLNVDDYRKVIYSGQITYDDGTPIANATVTLSTNGYKLDGTYTEVEATDTTYKECVNEMPSDWDRSTGPENVTWYELTFNEWMALTENAVSDVHITEPSGSDNGKIKFSSSTFIKLIDGTPYYYNLSEEIGKILESHGSDGLALGYVYSPYNGNKYELDFTQWHNLYSIKNLQINEGAYASASAFGYDSTGTMYEATYSFSLCLYNNSGSANSQSSYVNCESQLINLVLNSSPSTAKGTKIAAANTTGNCRYLQGVWIDSSRISEFPPQFIGDCPNLEKVVFMNPEQSIIEKNDSAFYSGYYSKYPKLKQLYLPNQNSKSFMHLTASHGYNINVLPNLESIWFDVNKMGVGSSAGFNGLTNMDANFYTRGYYGHPTYSTGVDRLVCMKWVSNLRFDNLKDMYSITCMDFPQYTTKGYTEGDFVSGGNLGYIYFGNPAIDLTNNIAALSCITQNSIDEIYYNVSIEDFMTNTNSAGYANFEKLYNNLYKDKVKNFHFRWNIHYDLDGGYSNQTLPSNYIDGWTEDGYITIPNPHKDGFSFIGWENKNSDTSILNIEQYDTYAVLRQDGTYGNVLLKAVWGPVSNPHIYTVTTDENGYYSFESIFTNDEINYLSYQTDSKWSIGTGITNDGNYRTLSNTSVDSANIMSTEALKELYTDNWVTVTSKSKANGLTQTFNIDLEIETPKLLSKELDEVTITTAPDKVDYEAGENFDPTGMVVKAKYKLTWSAPIDDEGNSVTYEYEEPTQYEYDNHNALKVTDTGIIVSKTDNGITKTAIQPINVTITPVIVSTSLYKIDIVTPPHKTSYFTGKYFEAAGMVVDATYENIWNIGEPTYTVVKNVAYDYNEKSPLLIDDDKITVHFTDDGITKYAYQNITVRDAEVVSRTLYSIEIVKEPDKTTYWTNSYFDPAGMVVDAVYALIWEDGKKTYETVKNVNYEYNNHNPLALTDESIEVSYTDTGATKTAYQPITVIDAYPVSRELDSITIITPPDKTEYFVAQRFNPYGMVVDASYKVTWSDGNISYETAHDVNYQYDNHDELTPYDNNIIVSYTDTGVTKTANQPITVRYMELISKELDHIVIRKAPDKISYYAGESFDKTGMEVDAYYILHWEDGSDSTQTVTNVEYEYDNHGKLNLDDGNIIVSYTDLGTTKTANQKITVEDKMMDSIFYEIKIVVPPTTTAYIKNSYFDPSGMVVDAIYEHTWSSGKKTYTTAHDVEYEYDNHEKLQLDNNQIVISRTEDDITKVAYQPITVREAKLLSKTLDSIEIVQEPDKVDYWVGQEFDKTGMIVDAIYKLDWEDKVTTYETVHNVEYEYDNHEKLSLDDTKIIVSYTDKVTRTAEQPITVSKNIVKSIKGNITVNGTPLANAKVTLHSEPITTYTDENGNYEFHNVTVEEHTLTIYSSADANTSSAEIKVNVAKVDESSDIGVFTIVKKDGNEISTSVKDNEYTVNCNIIVNEPEDPDEPDEPNEPVPEKPDEPKTGDETPIEIMTGILISSMLILFILKRKSKNKLISN